MEIFPGIFQIKLPLRNNPAGHINTYLLKGNDGWVLVDTGWDDLSALDELSRQLGNIGIRIEDISLVIYTHIHPDHYGLAGVLKQKYGTKLVLHRRGKDSIVHRYFGKETFIKELADWHLINGGSQDHADAVEVMSIDYIGHVSPVLPDTFLDAGDIISTGQFSLEVIWTPGHDQDHICLYEPENRVLLCGDHILPDTVTHVGIQTECTENPLLDYVNSLKAIRHLDVEAVLPAHEYIFNNFSDRIDSSLYYHNRVHSEIINGLSDGPKTAYGISETINWTESPVQWKSLPVLVQALFATKTLAYLKALVMESKVQRVDKYGLTVYNAT
ncbi:MAG: MBL fold metallo-hydrolase [Chloroflexi bacterium]|nr:MBL fold metallo-hydrolase [Chloroflexota bacterium]